MLLFLSMNSIILKLDGDNLEKKVETVGSNQYTLFEFLLFSHSDYGFQTVKTYANKRTALEEK